MKSRETSFMPIVNFKIADVLQNHSFEKIFQL